MKWTTYHSLYDTNGTVVEGSWSKLWTSLSRHIETDDKGRAPLWAPHELMPGFTRSAKGVDYIHAAVFDLDKGSEPDVSKLKDFLWFAHTTYSHKANHPKWRVVCPLAFPVRASDWPRVWDALVKTYMPDSDPACKDGARAYYVPSCAPGAPREVRQGKGELLPVPDIMGRLSKTPGRPPAQPGGFDAPATVPLTRADLLKLSAKLSKAQDDTQRGLGSALATMLEGAPYSVEGGRNDLLWKLCGELKYRFPLAHPPSAWALLRPSIEATEGAPAEAEFLSMWDRARRDVVARRIEQFGKGREYVESEYEALALGSGVPMEAIRSGRFWFAYTSLKQVFVLTLGGYVPVRLDLATVRGIGQGRIGPPLVTLQADGKPRAPHDILADYGTMCKDIRASYHSEGFEYVGERPSLVIRSARLCPIEPKFSARVHSWLRGFAGEGYPFLLQWIANIKDLANPDHMLAIMGNEGGTGKSFFLNTLARLFGGHATEVSQLLKSQFQPELFSCPVIIQDEAGDLPKRAGVDLLKQLVTQKEQRAESKGQDALRVQGCVRVAIATNNEEWLELYGSAISEGAASAATSRIFPLFVGAECKASVDGITEQEMTAHFLYLIESLPVMRFGRFTLPSSFSQRVQETVEAGGGPHLRLTAWIRQAIAMPGLEPKVEVAPGGVVFRGRHLSDALGISKSTVQRYCRAFDAVQLQDKRWFLTWSQWAAVEGEEGVEELVKWALPHRSVSSKLAG